MRAADSEFLGNGNRISVQRVIRAWVDRRYDVEIMRSTLDTVFYPVVYWMMMAFIIFFYRIPAPLGRPPKVTTWRIRRDPV